MPRAPPVREPRTPHTPLGYTASKKDANESVDLYLDYNGVLNREGLDGLNEFVTRLDHVDVMNLSSSDVLRITLLSFRRNQRKCVNTLDELAEAKVLNMFHNIVFTADRHGYREGKLERYLYEPMKRNRISLACMSEDNNKTNTDYYECEPQYYEWFTGGKDAYIAQRQEKESTRIIFVDDKWENVKAVKTSRSYATCIWMPRRSKRYEEEEYVLNRGRYNKAFNLEELYRTVIAASIMIRENSMAIQLSEQLIMIRALNGRLYSYH